jgi:hypothetical protein
MGARLWLRIPEGQRKRCKNAANAGRAIRYTSRYGLGRFIPAVCSGSAAGSSGASTPSAGDRRRSDPHSVGKIDAGAHQGDNDPVVAGHLAASPALGLSTKGEAAATLFPSIHRLCTTGHPDERGRSRYCSLMSIFCLMGRHKPSPVSLARSKDHRFLALCDICAVPLERSRAGWRAIRPDTQVNHSGQGGRPQSGSH